MGWRTFPHGAPRSPRIAMSLAASFSVAATAAVVAFVAARLLGGDHLPWRAAPMLAFTPYAFTPYAIAPAVLALALAAVLRRWINTACAGTALGVLLILVVPRTVARDQPLVPREARTVRVMSANVFRGQADPAALVALIAQRQIDVLSLQEATPEFLGQLRGAGLSDLLPYRQARDGSRWNDTAVLSRWPVQRSPERLPSVYLPTSVAVPGGPPVPVLSAHPTPPVSREGEARWGRWLAAVPAPRSDLGIVAGDLNATLDHGELHRILGMGWRDAAREAGAGLEPTWHGRRAAWLTLDHVLVAPGVAVRGYAVDDLVGSDHRAISATVQLPD